MESKSIEHILGYFIGGEVEYNGKKYDLSGVFEYRGWQNTFNAAIGIGSKFAALVSYDVSTKEVLEFLISEDPQKGPGDIVNMKEDFTSRGWFTKDVQAVFGETIEKLFGKEVLQTWSLFEKSNNAIFTLRNIFPLNKQIYFNDKVTNVAKVLTLDRMFTLTIPQGPVQFNLNIMDLKMRISGVRANLYEGYYKKL